MKRLSQAQSNYLSKPEIQFWVPIIIYVVSLTVAFMSLKSGQELILTQMSTYVTKVDNLNVALNKVETNLTILDTMHNITRP
jgi:hypothetical protein